MKIFYRLFIIIFLLFAWLANAQKNEKTIAEKKEEQIVGVYYLVNMFGHLHQTANSNSISLTTIACGHPIKVLKTEKSQNQTWFLAEIGAHKGYVLEDHLSAKKPDCFQGTYPSFFNLLNLDLAQMYYWGRLYDQFLEFEVKVQ